MTNRTREAGRGAVSVLGRTIRPFELTEQELAVWRRIQCGNRLLDSAFFAPEFTLALGAARDDARVTVLSRGDGVLGFFPHHHLKGKTGKPIGGPMSDYHGVISGQSAAISASQLLAACGLDAYDFNHAPAEFAYLADDNLGQSISPRIERPLGSAGFDEAPDKGVKLVFKDVDRCLRKLERDHGTWTFTLRDKDHEAWDWLVDMKTRQLAKRGKVAGFEEPWVSRTYDALWSNRTDTFEPMLSTLRANGRILAAHLALRWRHVISWWQTTYDDEFRSYGPGIAIIILTMRQAANDDIRVVDFGRGTEPYKLVLANAKRALVEGSIARPGTRAAALRAGHRLVTEVAGRLPLGRHQDIPKRAMTRLISGVRLPPSANGHNA